MVVSHGYFSLSEEVGKVYKVSQGVEGRMQLLFVSADIPKTSGQWMVSMGTLGIQLDAGRMVLTFLECN